MFNTWTNDKFEALYNATQAAILAGTRLFRWKAGDTEAEKELTIDLRDKAMIAAINAEFNQRWPDRVGRTRETRRRAVFSA